MSYGIRDQLIEGLVKALHPSREDLIKQQNRLASNAFSSLIRLVLAHAYISL